MKNIDPKSLIIGVLATALVFACTDSNKKNSASPSLVSEAKAATSKDDRGKWDNAQEWLVATERDLYFTYDNNGSRSTLIEKTSIGKNALGGERLVKHVTDGWEPFAINYFRKRIK
jgi:hypothetical protein